MILMQHQVLELKIGIRATVGIEESPIGIFTRRSIELTRHEISGE
jgi:hypothetical protein